jgi:hypothetical protein
MIKQKTKNIPVFLTNNKHVSSEDKLIQYQTTSEEKAAKVLVTFVDTLMTR